MYVYTYILIKYFSLFDNLGLTYKQDNTKIVNYIPNYIHLKFI